MKILNYFKQKYIDAKDLVLLFYLKRGIKKAKKQESKMVDKVIRIWQ